MDRARHDDRTPGGWDSIENLVCGFGSRTVEAPAATRLLRTQVHGNRIADAGVDDTRLGRDAADGYARVEVEADALVCSRAGIVAGVRTADCVPILLVAPQRRWAAAVHAGWRGTVADIAGEAVRAAESAGVRPSGILAALGPSIGSCCYEVSEELGDQFETAGLPVLRRVGKKPHLDLRAANHVLLERSGVPRANIQNVGPCTRCASDRYHSYRAEPEAAGRQISWIGWR
jgi:YfiH family protein